MFPSLFPTESVKVVPEVSAKLHRWIISPEAGKMAQKVGRQVRRRVRKYAVVQGGIGKGIGIQGEKFLLFQGGLIVWVTRP